MGLHPKREDSCWCNGHDDERRNYDLRFLLAFHFTSFASPLMKEYMFYKRKEIKKMSIDLSKYPKGSVVKINSKGVEYVEIPGPTDAQIEKARKRYGGSRKLADRVRFVTGREI